MGLDQIRSEIDGIDEELQKLFLRRMALSLRVAETKKLTGADVYVPKREQEILNARTKGVSEELEPECRAFFGQMMEISRTYQYSKMTEGNELLKELPKKEKTIEIRFFCPSGSRQLSVFINAAALAGLNPEKVETERMEGGVRYSLLLSGDFSENLARGVVLQILKENETAVLTSSV